MVHPLEAVSPLDGRYAGITDSLRPYVSERALMRARLHVEVEYLLALAALDETSMSVDPEVQSAIREVYRNFDIDDAKEVKRIETAGDENRPPTNHDVKAVEYYLRDELAAMDAHQLIPWVHFALTSEDVTNLAYRLLIRDAVEEELLPVLDDIRDELVGMARDHRDLPMLARTHGQPATPTTFGKEMAVYAVRVGRAAGRIRQAVADLSGKLAGASGTYAAHQIAYPAIDWRQFSREFIAELGFDQVEPTTQINPGDDLAALFDAIAGCNNVCLDLAVDAWLYVADGYLGQHRPSTETGSSTMPHKVNPIDFENSEGNLSKASNDLRFLATSLTQSRLQRDLSDSTIKRTIGTAFAHSLLGYEKLATGLSTVRPNERAMREDLADNPAVIGEAVQTILRREGQQDAYERVKELTKDRDVSMADFTALFEQLPLEESVHDELADLSPETYTGLAADLVDTCLNDQSAADAMDE